MLYPVISHRRYNPNYYSTMEGVDGAVFCKALGDGRALTQSITGENKFASVNVGRDQGEYTKYHGSDDENRLYKV